MMTALTSLEIPLRPAGFGGTSDIHSNYPRRGSVSVTTGKAGVLTGRAMSHRTGMMSSKRSRDHSGAPSAEISSLTPERWGKTMCHARKPQMALAMLRLSGATRSERCLLRSKPSIPTDFIRATVTQPLLRTISDWQIAKIQVSEIQKLLTPAAAAATNANNDAMAAIDNRRVRVGRRMERGGLYRRRCGARVRYVSFAGDRTPK